MKLSIIILLAPCRAYQLIATGKRPNQYYLYAIFPKLVAVDINACETYCNNLNPLAYYFTYGIETATNEDCWCYKVYNNGLGNDLGRNFYTFCDIK